MITVLGAGRVGGFIARELVRRGHDRVRVGDGAADRLKLLEGLVAQTRQVDFGDSHGIRSLLEDTTLVINAVPGFLGFSTLQLALEAGINVVDIAFMPENPLELDDLAKRNGAVAVVDFGVAPGMSNLLCAAGARMVEEALDCSVMVGGLPVIRRKPWEYSAPFSPIDVLEEYTRPARLVENGQVVVRPALSGLELVDLPGVGTLEVFNTDGLRTLTENILAPWMRERTLRYPGHVEKIKLLLDTGLLDTTPVQTPAGPVRPIDVTAARLFEHWSPRPGDEELTVMQVEVQGMKAGERVRHLWDLLDFTDPVTGDSSMARTTGLPAVLMAELLLGGKSGLKPGVIPPEVIGGSAELTDYIMGGLAARGVGISYRTENQTPLA